MGLYSDHVLPRIINAACGMKAANPYRERVCAGLKGEVIEIGFGSGHNVPFYPAAVERVAAIEPADLGWELAAKRVAESPVPGSRCRTRLTGSLPVGLSRCLVYRRTAAGV